MNVTTIGIDIAKRIFQIHGVNANGKTVLKKKLMRDGYFPTKGHKVARLNACIAVFI